MSQWHATAQLLATPHIHDDACRNPQNSCMLPGPDGDCLTLTAVHFSDLDRLLTQLRDRLPQLSYLSLLGNTACPSQLSGHHHSDDDYRRYRHGAGHMAVVGRYDNAISKNNNVFLRYFLKLDK